jgi:phage baseplate assembly protein W
MTNAISYPFSIDIFGNVKSTTTVNKIYLDRVLTLLSTNIGQRPILQDYGTDLMQALFENDNNLETAVSQAVRQAIARWIPNIGVKEILVGPVNQEGQAEVVITLVMPDSTLSSVTLSTATFGADGTITR